MRTFGRIGSAAAGTAALLAAGFAATWWATTALLELATEDWIALGPAIVVTALLFPVAKAVSTWTIRRRRDPGPEQYAVVADVLALAQPADDGPTDLSPIAEAIGRGLGTASCRLTVAAPRTGEQRFDWAEGAEAAGPVLTSPVHYGEEQVGELAVRPLRSTRLRHGRLLADLAEILGPVLHNERLARQLQHELNAALGQAHELASARRRAVAEMDNERRALERNLHDGAQHHLVALQMTVGVLEHDLAHGRTDAARARVPQLVEQIDQTSSLLVDTAAGVFPTTLAERGLVAALVAELRDTGAVWGCNPQTAPGGKPPDRLPTVALDIDDAASDRRFPLVVETAIYFACLEAVNNARKHAPDAQVTVTVRNGYRGLNFTVRDTGPGFSTATGPGRGVRNMAQRIEAVGGTVTLSSAPGAGTVVDVFIPI